MWNKDTNNPFFEVYWEEGKYEEPFEYNFPIIERKQNTIQAIREKLIWEEDLSDEEVVVLYRNYKYEWEPVPKSLQKRYDIHAEKHQNLTHWSWSEKLFQDAIREHFPNIECNLYLDGYEIDIFIPEQKIIIEVDWPHHEEEIRQKKDIKKDDYMKKVYGYDTIRVNSQRENIEKIIAYLKNIIYKKTD